MVKCTLLYCIISLIVIHIKNRSDLYPGYLLFLTLQSKKTNFRGHKLTQNKVQKNKNKIKGPEKVPTLARKIWYGFLKITSSGKQEAGYRAGKPQKGSRAHRSKLGSWVTSKIYNYIGIPMQVKKKMKRKLSPSLRSGTFSGSFLVCLSVSFFRVSLWPRKFVF